MDSPQDGYHEWRWEAIVFAASGDRGVPANWEVQRDGSIVHDGRTVIEAQRRVREHLWKPRKQRT